VVHKKCFEVKKIKIDNGVFWSGVFLEVCETRRHKYKNKNWQIKKQKSSHEKITTAF